ncbi:hypothetical protein Hanom_Chr00s107005g01806221 [Helianthus anomalus]
MELNMRKRTGCSSLKLLQKQLTTSISYLRKSQRGYHDLHRHDNFKTLSESCYCWLQCNQGLCVYICEIVFDVYALLTLISCCICQTRTVFKPRRHVSVSHHLGELS